MYKKIVFLVLASIILISGCKLIKLEKEIKLECFGEGKIFDAMRVPNATCCQGLIGLDWAFPEEVIGRPDRCIATITWEKVCTKCGDGECGKGENWCVCEKDCPRPEEIPCTKDIECGLNTCGQGRDICYEIRHFCREGECVDETEQFINMSCKDNKCQDLCGNGICDHISERLWCPEDCE